MFWIINTRFRSQKHRQVSGGCSQDELKSASPFLGKDKHCYASLIKKTLHIPMPSICIPGYKNKTS